MIRLTRATATAIVAAAAVTIAACSTSASTPHAAPARRTAPKPPTCHQQYETWKHGTAARSVRSLLAALRKVQSAGAAEDIPQLGTALARAGRAASRLTAYPVPRCADPAGYYASFLTHIQAAGDNAKSTSGLGGLMLAEVPLKAVPGIERRLDAELNRTVGKHR